MRRTRLFHSIVIVGSSLLASCDKGSAPAPVVKTRDAAVKDAPPVPLIDAPPPVRIQADQPPELPRIMVERPPSPPRIQVKPPPQHPKIQVRRPPKIPRI